MSLFSQNDLRKSLYKLRWPLRLTWFGILAESVLRAFWPLLALVLVVLSLLMMGVQDAVRLEAVWAGAVLAVLAAGAALWFAVRRFRLPAPGAAMARLDDSLPGRPIQALLDEAAIGGQDEAAMAVWRAHKARMAERAAAAKHVPGDLRLASRDPYALRFVALLVFTVAVLFGSVHRVGSVAGMAPGAAGLANGAVWEGWAEPPRYTGLPTLYLNDQAEGPLDLPEGTLITLRFYGEVGALTLTESVSGQTADPEAAAKVAQDFTVLDAGEIRIDGPGGRTWAVAVRADDPPAVQVLAARPDVSALGEMTLPFAAEDDYGVEAGEARIVLDLASVDRRYGLTFEPEQREAIVVPLPTPIAGNRVSFEENLIEDFSKHPWANLPVTLQLSVLDAAEQQGTSDAQPMVLPGRRFFNPAAAAMIEMRRDLLWSRDNAPRMAQVMRAVSYQGADVLRSETTTLRVKRLIERLELRARYGIDETLQDELAEDLWGLALELEEGVLADALERLRRAQERLQEAMRNGASDEEIAELMEELRRATEEYLQQLQRQQAQEGQQNPQNQEGQQGESMQMTQDDLQRMMDRIQELMEQGRMAEAAQALQELQELMENLRMSEGQQGQQGQSPGQQAMEGLADTLREQQGLSDQAFRDLQEQFNPGAQAGESQGNEGRNGGQGRGQSHEGQQGQGQAQEGGDGQQPGEGQQGPGQERADGGDQQGMGSGAQELAQRQRELRDELRRQQSQLPGQGSPGGDAARDALDRAGRAMDQAEESLRNQDLAEAIDNQAQAMEALREGMRSLGEAMAQEQQNQQPGQGNAESDRRADNRDPLGREQGSNGSTSSEGPLAMGPGGAGRARELLDEIRRRSGETERPEVERDYLNRLLDRF